MAIVEKTRSIGILGHELEDRVIFYNTDVDAEPEDCGRLRNIILAKLDWEDMGRPRTITVTIEPGDRLNG